MATSKVPGAANRKAQRRALEKSHTVQVQPRRDADIQQLAAWYPAVRALIVIAGKATRDLEALRARSRWQRFRAFLARLFRSVRVRFRREP